MINKALNRHKEVLEKKKLLIGYLLAGYPNSEDFIQLLKDLEDTELDVLEIGFPSKNPYADGDVIKAAHESVDLDLSEDINYWRQIRKTTSKPIWLMAYKEDFIDNGLFLEFSKESLIDAVVIPDCSYEEHNILEEELREYNVDVLKFIKPTLSIEEIKEVASNSTILYGQLYDGPTGVVNEVQDYNPMLDIALESSNAKIYAGFGISTKEKVKELLEEGFHGTIIGTAMIKKLNISKEELIDYINEIKEYIID